MNNLIELVKLIRQWREEREQSRCFNSHGRLQENHCEICNLHLGRFKSLSCNAARHIIEVRS